MKTQLHPSPPTPADRVREITQYSEVKRLADNIQLLQQQKPFRSLAILSLFPGEGKTLTAAALAVAISETSQARTLVVDTTTFRNPRSLALKQCIPSNPLIDFVSLEEYRKSTNGNGNGYGHHAEEPLKAEIIGGQSGNGSVGVMVRKDSDQLFLRKLADESAPQYGLVILDTAPMTARNRSNLDPLLVARMADASVLVVNPAMMQGEHLSEELQSLKDPTLHLLGLISNEEFFK
jgi:Mrp family chromosome partitioning ATPase